MEPHHDANDSLAPSMSTSTHSSEFIIQYIIDTHRKNGIMVTGKALFRRFGLNYSRAKKYLDIAYERELDLTPAERRHSLTPKSLTSQDKFPPVKGGLKSNMNNTPVTAAGVVPPTISVETSKQPIQLVITSANGTNQHVCSEDLKTAIPQEDVSSNAEASENLATSPSTAIEVSKSRRNTTNTDCKADSNKFNEYLDNMSLSNLARRKQKRPGSGRKPATALSSSHDSDDELDNVSLSQLVNRKKKPRNIKSKSSGSKSTRVRRTTKRLFELETGGQTSMSRAPRADAFDVTSTPDAVFGVRADTGAFYGTSGDILYDTT